MTDRIRFPRSSTDDEIAIEVLAGLLDVTIEEATRTFNEEGENTIGEEERPLRNRRSDSFPR